MKHAELFSEMESAVLTCTYRKIAYKTEDEWIGGSRYLPSCSHSVSGSFGYETFKWPPSPSDVSENEKSIKVSNPLYNFLAWLVWTCASSNFCNLAAPFTQWLRPQVQTVMAGRLAATIASPSTGSLSFKFRGRLKLVFCSCKKGFGMAMCSCCSNGMQCTDVCQCVDCLNCLQEGQSLADENSDNSVPSGDETSWWCFIQKLTVCRWYLAW